MKVTRSARRTVRLIRHKARMVERRLNPRSGGSQHRKSWDARWGDSEYRPRFELEAEDASVRKAVADGWFSRGDHALDIGCGAGHNTAFLAEQGLEAVGIDFSTEAIGRAREAYGEQSGATFAVVDVTAPGAYARTFDVLVDRGCLHGIEQAERGAYLHNLESWGKPGSRLLLIVRNKHRTQDQVVGRTRRLLDPGFILVSDEPVDLAGQFTDDRLPAVAMRFVRSG